MNKNYFAPQVEVATIESQSMMLESSPIPPPQPKGDIKVDPSRQTTQVW